jgi:hypothetical protein
MATAPQTTEIAMKLRISKEAGERLASRAAESGRDVAEVASELIEQAVAAPPVRSDAARQLAALASFAQGMTAWTSAHLPAGHVVDDSRESIYEGRGG